MSAAQHTSKPVPRENARSLSYPAQKLGWDAPFRWLKLGWEDYKKTWKLSALYGLFFALCGVAISAMVIFYGNKILLFSLGILFILLGPLFAFGLYDVSRQLQLGEKPCLSHSFYQVKRSAPNQWVFACVLIVIGLVWMRAATIIHVFYPTHADPLLEELLAFFTVGSLAGAFFLGLVFGSSAFSLPMMVDRNVDSITASISSLNAVLKNKGVAILWGSLILMSVIVGFATGFLGLVIVLPVIGYATFHGAQEAILDPKTEA